MKRESILVIEDDLPLCWLLEKFLGQKYDITIKNDSVEAMYWLTDGHIPDLIITDFQMPTLSGTDFLKFLKKSGVFNNIPVVMLSGSANDQIKQECLAFGLDHFVEKPFDPEKLETLVRNVLKNRDNYAEIN